MYSSQTLPLFHFVHQQPFYHGFECHGFERSYFEQATGNFMQRFLVELSNNLFSDVLYSEECQAKSLSMIENVCFFKAIFKLYASFSGVHLMITFVSKFLFLEMTNEKDIVNYFAGPNASDVFLW